jgi:lipopolysaccharide transport system permease protein
MNEVIHNSRPASVWAYASLLRMFRQLAGHWGLIDQLIRRELAVRYKTTFFGMVWPVLMPLLMLGVYTFVFGQVFGVVWPSSATPSTAVNGSTALFNFSLTLYCGLVLFNIFSEAVAGSVSIIISNPNYVKKVVFPLEVLPVVTLGVALFHFLMSLIILLVGVVVFLHIHKPTMLFFPVAILPMVCLTLGVAWAVASVGVFIRDLGTVIGFLIQLLLYGSPVFYPLSMVKEPYRSILNFNPVTHIIEAGRRTLLWGLMPQWGPWLATFAATLLIMLGGYMIFMRSRHAFSDIV